MQVKAHDEHHVIPTVNYGQYIMLWDRLMGTYKKHPLLAAPDAARVPRDKTQTGKAQ